MWRTGRSCGKLLVGGPGTSWQTYEPEELRDSSYRRGVRTGETFSRWKTSWIRWAGLRLLGRGPFWSCAPNQTTKAFVPRGTSPVSTLVPKLFHVEHATISLANPTLNYRQFGSLASRGRPRSEEHTSELQ